MAQTNVKDRKHTAARPTHEGGRGMAETPLASFERVLNTCMLWEDSFYLNGEDISVSLSKALQDAMNTGRGDDPHRDVRRVILDARGRHNIRHASLYAAVMYAKMGGKDARLLIEGVIQRADELAEVIAMAGGKRMPHAVRRGVNGAFPKFDRYQFAKYKGTDRKISLRDAVFLTHPSRAAQPLVEDIVNDTLGVADTWESALSSGADKRETFERLLGENRLGAMALLRNLRNMREANVDRTLIAHAFEQANWSRVLPFRFLTAALQEPGFADLLELGFDKAVASSVYLPGRTAVLVDTSASMSNRLSAKSVMTRAQVGAAMAAAINGDHVDLYSWADRTKQIYKARGLGAAMAMRQHEGEVGHGTNVEQAVQFANLHGEYDRLVVLTDMQFANGASKASRYSWAYGGVLPVPQLKPGQRGYTLNLAAYDNPGLMLGDWTHLSGFSAAIIKFMATLEGSPEAG